MQQVKKLVLTAAALILCAQPLLYAQTGGKKGGERPVKKGEKMCMMEHRGPFFGDPERMKKEFNLTDEQVKKIGEINREHEKKMLEYKEVLAPKEIQLKKLLLEDTVDIEKVRSLLKEIGNVRVDLQVLRIQQRLEIEKVLTPDQKAKMRQHRMQRMKKKGEDHPKGHKGHGRSGHDMQD